MRRRDPGVLLFPVANIAGITIVVLLMGAFAGYDVQNSSSAGLSATPVTATGGQNNNIAKVQRAINESLPKDLRANLGGDFFIDSARRATTPARHARR